MANEQHRRRTGSFSRRRLSSQSLSPLRMPAADTVEWPVWSYSDSRIGKLPEDDVYEEGRELFKNFVAEQIEKESPDILALEEVDIRTPVEFKYPIWKKAGRDLRMYADEFARTKERENVRLQAAGIPRDMGYEEFCALLEELFQGEGITSERIVVLFFFCSDVAIRFLKTGVEMFHRFLDWSLTFIMDRVCSWVQMHGGWSQVLRSPFNSWKKAFFWGTLSLVSFLVIRYWRRQT